ncbi:MAG: DUF2163 domain-containing protein [Pararhodobacter sp.]|nr:DUF2163 domain-containing protein [Pararhodobacter sp.]
MSEERATTRARAWALTRADGVVMGFTDHDGDLVFEGVTFRADTGMTARALVQATGLSVDNTEAAGALRDGGLTEADIGAGRYDGAALVIWEVDWTDVSDRRVLFRGALGEITRAGGAFQAELRGLTEPLNRSGGRVFGALCPAVLGDGPCRFDLTTPGFVAEAALLAVQEDGAVLHLPPLEAFAPGWFAEGRVLFADGLASGLVGFVRRDEPGAGVDGARRITLWSAPGAVPLAGNALQITAGCDKRFVTCRVKFANQVNFQGFPHVPGDDWLLAVPRVDGPNEGGRRP